MIYYSLSCIVVVVNCAFMHASININLRMVVFRWYLETVEYFEKTSNKFH